MICPMSFAKYLNDTVSFYVTFLNDCDVDDVMYERVSSKLYFIYTMIRDFDLEELCEKSLLLLKEKKIY